MPFLYASLTLFLIWIALIIFSKETRREQWIMSFLGLLLTPGALNLVLHSPSAGTPVIGATAPIEVTLFGFSLFGIAAVAYQVILSKRPIKKRKREKLSPIHMHWLSHIVIIGAIWVLISTFSFAVLGVSAIMSAALGGLLIGSYIISARHDLLEDALVSGFVLGLLVFLLGQLFGAQFIASSTPFTHESAFLIGSVPIEEIVFAIIVGFSVGPLYEYVRQTRLR